MRTEPQSFHDDYAQFDPKNLRKPIDENNRSGRAQMSTKMAR